MNQHSKQNLNIIYKAIMQFSSVQSIQMNKIRLQRWHHVWECIVNELKKNVIIIIIIIGMYIKL